MAKAQLRFEGRKFLGGSKNQPSEGWIDVFDYVFSIYPEHREKRLTSGSLVFMIEAEEVAHELYKLVEKPLGTAELDVEDKQKKRRFIMTNAWIFYAKYPMDDERNWVFTMDFEK